MNRLTFAINSWKLRGLCLGILLFSSACSSGLPTPGSPSATITQSPLATQTRQITQAGLTAILPSPSLTNTPTLASTPAITGIPLSTGTPLAAGAPTLPSFSKKGPGLLVYNGSRLDYYQIGSTGGWADYQFPDPFSAINVAVAPGGNWIAIDGMKASSTNSAHNLELLRLSDDRVIPVTQLDPGLPNPTDNRVNATNDAIQIGNMLWSPDGRTLAFQSALGSSQVTDIYIVQIDQRHLTRLTHQSYNADILSWTPDSQRLIYTEDAPCAWNGCFTDSVWSVDLEGQAEKLIDTPAATGIAVFGFRSTGKMLVGVRGSLGTFRSLMQVDFSTHTSDVLYAGDFYEAAVDPASGTVLFSVFAAGLADGYYFVSTPGNLPQRVDLAFSGTSVRWLPKINAFRVCPGEGGCNGLTLISPEGKTTRITVEKSEPIPSPDGIYLAYTYTIADNPVDTYNLVGIRIYDRSMTLLKTYADSRLGLFTWSSDSKGFFYVADRAIYYQDLSNRMPETIEQAVPGDPTRDQYTWVY